MAKKSIQGMEENGIKLPYGWYWSEIDWLKTNPMLSTMLFTETDIKNKFRS